MIDTELAVALVWLCSFALVTIVGELLQLRRRRRWERHTAEALAAIETPPEDRPDWGRPPSAPGAPSEKPDGSR